MARLSAFVVFAFLPLLAQAEVYRWTDAKGQRHYSQFPPPGAQARTLAPPPPASAAPNQESLNRILDESDKAEPKIREEAAKAAEDQARRQQQCHQAREQIAYMDAMTGRRRMTTTDEQGNVSRVTDEQATARRAELEGLVASSCN